MAHSTFHEEGESLSRVCWSSFKLFVIVSCSSDVFVPTDRTTLQNLDFVAERIKDLDELLDQTYEVSLFCKLRVLWLDVANRSEQY